MGGELKPWSRHLESEFANCSDDHWYDEALQSFSGYQAWVLQNPDEIKKQADHDGLLVGPDGKSVYWKPTDKSLHCENGQSDDDMDSTVAGGAEPELGEALETPEAFIN